MTGVRLEHLGHSLTGKPHTARDRGSGELGVLDFF